MLKSLILVVLSAATFSAFAEQRTSSSDSYKACTNAMSYYFLASNSESATVCTQNSSPEFLKCMANLGTNTNLHVLEAAPRCSPNRLRIPLQTQDPNYLNLNSCPARMQMYARMSDHRALQICNWDSSPVMQNCLTDLVQKAHFHSEHAIQYCGFANTEYRNKIPKFVACVIGNSQRGLDVYSSVVNCDEKLTGVISPHPVQQDQNVSPQVEVKPEVAAPVIKAPEVKPEIKNQQPTPEVVKANTGRKVPTPVEIKIEGSSKPEVEDQPIDTGSTSNSESLPM